MKRTKLSDRKLPDYTKGEEVFNMVTHIVGGVLGILTLIFSIILAADHGNGWGVVTGSIFGSSMIILYAISSVYHGLSPKLKAKKVMQVIDHCAVFVLIAGTYTPIALCSLREYDPILGWAVFIIIWAAAIVGIVFNSIDLKRYAKFSMICYLGMGWCVILTFGAMMKIFPFQALALLIGGGVAYTVGAILYGLGRKLRYAHSIFHCFVLLGSMMHILFVLYYVI